MQFNAEKFQNLRYKHTKLNEKQTGYTIRERIAIILSKSLCYLSVGMSNDTSFQMHITKLADT